MKKVLLFLTFILIGLAIVIMVMRISNPLLASVFFSPEREYQITYTRRGEAPYTVKKKEVLKLFIGKEIIRDDSQKDIGMSNGDAVYLIGMKRDKIMAYYDNAPDHAVVCYQGKYYRINNPEYPITISPRE